MDRNSGVVVFGQRGSYSDILARKLFGGDDFLYADWIPDIFKALNRTKKKVAVLPAYNSIEAEVELTWRGLYENPRCRIVREKNERIEHCLLTSPRTKHIGTIASKDIALGQCKRWLHRHGYTKDKQMKTSSTAAAAEYAAKNTGVGAIASLQAAELYGLRLVKRNIADNKRNKTRFFIVQKDGKTELTGYDKTSIAIETREDRPGLLYEILRDFKRRQVNMTMLFSRPIPTEEDAYIFFIDFEGHTTDPKIARMLRAIEDEHDIVVLGSYPRDNNIHKSNKQI